MTDICLEVTYYFLYWDRSTLFFSNAALSIRTRASSLSSTESSRMRMERCSSQQAYLNIFPTGQRRQCDVRDLKRKTFRLGCLLGTEGRFGRPSREYGSVPSRSSEQRQPRGFTAAGPSSSRNRSASTEGSSMRSPSLASRTACARLNSSSGVGSTSPLGSGDTP